MYKLEYFSNVKEGRLQKNISELISKEIKYFEGKRVQITIQKQRSTRSNRQNRLFHLYVDIMRRELGYDFEEMKDIIKYKFLLKERVHEETGEVFKYLGKTSELSKSEFSDLVTDLIRWASVTFGIVLPLPEEQFEMGLND